MKDTKKKTTSKAEFDGYWQALVLGYPSFQPHDMDGVQRVYFQGLKRYPVEVMDEAITIIHERDRVTIEAGFKPTFPTLSELQAACAKAEPRFRRGKMLAVLSRDICIADQVKGSNVQCACKTCRPLAYCSVHKCTAERQTGKDTCWSHARGIETSGPVEGKPIRARNLSEALAEVAAKKKMP